MFYIHKSKFEYQEVDVSSFDIYFLLMGPMFTKGEVRQAYISENMQLEIFLFL